MHIRLPHSMIEPMSLAISIRQNRDSSTALEALPRLILSEVHLKLQEHWRERIASHKDSVFRSNKRTVGTFHNDTYWHALPADGTPLLLVNDMSFQDFIEGCKLIKQPGLCIRLTC